MHAVASLSNAEVLPLPLCATTAPLAARPATVPKLLVIDDDPALLQAIQLRLRDYYVDLLAAYHGMHGIWLATTKSPDLIVTDLRMPQGQGDYVMQCLKQRTDTASIPVMVLTGRRDNDLTARLLRLGAVKVLQKPIAFKALVAEAAHFIPFRRRD
jgi:response regulator RpfG family c-di-GMP phosphodiesterase